MVNPESNNPPALRSAGAALGFSSARRQLDTHARGYRDVRTGIDAKAISRAHAEWALSLFEWAEAAIAYAAAEDGIRIPEPDDGNTSDGQGEPAAKPTLPETQLARYHRDACWDEYQHARKDNDLERIRQSHEQWRAALLTWVQAFTTAEGVTDQVNIEARRLSLDQQMQVGVRQDQTARTRVVSQSRERTRRSNLQREARLR